MKKFIPFLIILIISIFMISACGNEKQENNNTATDQSIEETEKDTNQITAPNGYSELVAYIEETTEGTAHILYENNNPQIHEMEGINVSLDSYVVIELNNFNDRFADSFDHETDGGVIISHYTIKNELDHDAYYMPHPYMEIYGADQTYSNYYKLLPEEEQLNEKLNNDNDYLIKAGETISGYYTYPFGKTTLDIALDISTVTVYIGEPHAEKGEEVSSTFGKPTQFTLSLNEKGASKVSHNAAFYEDKVTFEDLGVKKMLTEKEGIQSSEQFGDITVTLDGYQFTSFTPNEKAEHYFDSLDDDIVLLTAKFLIDNKSEEDVGLASINSRVLIDGGSIYELSNGSLLDLGASDIIEPGDTGELLQIYVLEQKQYEENWPDKSFKILIGPMRNQEYKDISDGKEVTFPLPH